MCRLMTEISLAKKIGQGYNQFWHNKNFYRVVKGSRGSKKSKTIAYNLIHRLVKYPWANVLVIRRHSNTLRQSCYTELKWAIDQFGITKDFKFNQTLPEITYKPTGQKILFRGLDDPLKITSIAVDTGILAFVWIEEAYEIESANKLDTLTESIRGICEHEDAFRQVTISFNPWSEKHWLKKAFFDENPLYDDVFAMTTTYKVNEWLDDGTKARYERLYKTNPKRAKVVCDGDWGMADGLVFENFQELKEPLKPSELLEQGYQRINGIDYGYTDDPTAWIDAYVNEQEKKLYIHDEFYRYHLRIREIADCLIAKNCDDTTLMSEIDNVIIDELYDYGIYGITKVIKDRILAGIVELQDYEILVNPNCDNFLMEINNYTWKKNNVTDRYLNDPIDEFNHLIDALRYAMTALHHGVKLDFYKGDI